MHTSAPRHFEAKVANFIKMKKLPTIINMTLVKEEFLQLLLSTEHDSRLVNVRVGLYAPRDPTGSALLLVIRKTREKDAVRIQAPFNVIGPNENAPSSFCVARECVPERQVSGVCLPFFASTAASAREWTDELKQYSGSARPSSPTFSPTSGSLLSPRVVLSPRNHPTTKPIVRIYHGSTWARLGEVDLALFHTVGAVLELIVDCVLKDIPTNYLLCYSQPGETEFLRGACVVKDTGEVALSRFAGATLYIVPRETSTKIDTFAEWVDSLAQPGSVVPPLVRWQSLTLNARRNALTVVDRVVAQLRGDHIKRLLVTYGSSSGGPCITVDRYRFHDIGGTLMLPIAPQPHEELLNITNSGSVAVLVHVSLPICGSVIITATPEVLRLEPHETQHVLFRFMLRGISNSVDDATHFIHIFATGLVMVMEPQKRHHGQGANSSAQTIPASPRPMPVAASSAVSPSVSQKSSPHNSITQLEACPVVIPVVFSRMPKPEKKPDSTPTSDSQWCTVQRVKSAAAIGSIQNVADEAVGGLGLCKRVTVGSNLMLVHGVMLSADQFEADMDALQGVSHPTLLIPSIVLRPESTVGTPIFTELYYNCPAIQSNVLAAIVGHDPHFDNMELRLRVALDVAQALVIAHSYGLSHSAVKPENILITSFVHSKSPNGGGATPQNNALLVGSWLGSLPRKRTDNGTLYFTAPEVSGDLEGTTESDVFSFGMLLYTLTAGKLPFSELPEADYTNVSKMEERIMGGLRPSLSADDMSKQVRMRPEVRRLIESCWVSSPAQRPTMVKVLRELSLILTLIDGRMPVLNTLPLLAEEPNTFTVHPKNQSGAMATRQFALRATSSQAQPTQPQQPSPTMQQLLAQNAGNSQTPKSCGSPVSPLPTLEFGPPLLSSSPSPPGSLSSRSHKNLSVVTSLNMRADGTGSSPVSPKPSSPSTVVVSIKKLGSPQRSIKLRVSAVESSMSLLLHLACRYLRADPSQAHLFDEESGVAVDDIVLNELLAADTTGTKELSMTLASVVEEMVTVVVNLRSGNGGDSPLLQGKKSVEIGRFLPSATVREIYCALKKRNISLPPPFNSTKDLGLVDSKWMEVSDQDSPLVAVVTPVHEKDADNGVLVAAFSAVPRSELVRMTITRDVDSDVLHIASHKSVSIRALTVMCAVHWHVSITDCSLWSNDVDAMGEKLPPDSAVGSLRSSSKDVIPILFVHFVPVHMRFWNAVADGSCSGKGIDVTTCDGVTVRQVLRQAVSSLGIRDSTGIALAQHGTGIVLEDPQLSTEQYGQEFDIVPLSALKRVKVSCRCMHSKGKDVIVLLYGSGKPLLCSAVLAAPALRGLKKPILIDKDTAIEAAPDEPVESLRRSGSVRRFMAFSGDHSALRKVTVSCDVEDGQRSCFFRTLRRATACNVREKALSLLNASFKQPVLSDSGGCIIDDLCTMADLDSLTFVLCD